MKLRQILEQVDSCGLEVRFLKDMEDYCNPPMHITSYPVRNLYNDWYGFADHCPENGAYIYGIEFNFEGKSYWVDSNEQYTFEELMQEIENVFHLKEEQII